MSAIWYQTVIARLDGTNLSKADAELVLLPVSYSKYRYQRIVIIALLNYRNLHFILNLTEDPGNWNEPKQWARNIICVPVFYATAPLSGYE